MKRLLCCLIAITLFCLTACGNEKQNNDIPVITNDDRSITAFGIIRCQTRKSITVPFNADIEKVLVIEGERVVNGQRLIQLNASEHYAQIDKKQAEIDNLERLTAILEDKLEFAVTYLSLREGNKQQEAIIKLDFEKQAVELQAKIDNVNLRITDLENEWASVNHGIETETGSEWEKLKSSLQYAQQEWSNLRHDLSAFRELYEMGDISWHDYQLEVRKVIAKEYEIDGIHIAIDALRQNLINTADDIQLSIQQSQNDLALLEKTLKLMQSGQKLSLESETSNSESQIQSLQIDIKELQAAIEHNKRLMALEESSLSHMESSGYAGLNENYIICDIENAIVCTIKYAAGEMASAGSVILGLEDDSDIYIEVDIEEQSISNITENALVHIIPESNKSKFYTGRVSFISAIASQKNGETMITVRVSVDDADSYLIPYANAKVKIFPIE